MTDPNDLPEDIRDLLDAYCSGSADDAQVRELEAYLLSDEASRVIFVEYFYLHSELRFAARARRAADSIFETTGERRRRRETGWWKRWAIAQSRWRPWLIAAAACVLAVLTYGVAAGRRPNIVAPHAKVAAVAESDGNDSTDHPREWPNADSALAMIVKQEDARWNAMDGPVPAEGSVLSARRLHLLSGRVVLAFLNGVMLTLEGPADVELVSPDRVFCHRGRLRARIPEGAEGFVVASPESAVVDLGTEFGLNVDRDGRSRVMVFEGEAVAALYDAAGSPHRTQRVGQSEAFELDPRHRRIGETTAQPESFVPASELANPPLVLDPDYPEAVLYSHPRGYWRFERQADGRVPNQICGGQPLRIHGPVAITGASQGNGYALFRPEAPEQFLTTDGLWELARKPGHAVEFWFLADAIRYASLVGLYPPGEFNVPEARTYFVHNFFVELTARNHMHNLYKPASVRFLHRWPLDPKVGNNIVSEKIFGPRRWHHVVAQKNGDRMELYFDGEADHSMPFIADHQTVLCHLVVGRRNTDPSNQTDVRPFVGRLDELAIYDHPLSAKEVRSHFQLAAPQVVLRQTPQTVDANEVSNARTNPNPRKRILHDVAD